MVINWTVFKRCFACTDYELEISVLFRYCETHTHVDDTETLSLDLRKQQYKFVTIKPVQFRYIIGELMDAIH